DSAACLRNFGIFEMIINQMASSSHTVYIFKTEFRADGPLGRIHRSFPIDCEEEPVQRKNNVRNKATTVKKIDGCRGENSKERRSAEEIGEGRPSCCNSHSRVELTRPIATTRYHSQRAHARQQESNAAKLLCH
ncbi:hypothetical protein PFISCL1PPCAC_12771, partial [Pristionchus fissidentatus]